MTLTRRISRFRRLLPSGAAALLVLAAWSPAMATFPEGAVGPADGTELEQLLALGLSAQAERILRDDVAAGGTVSRKPLLRLLLRGHRIEEAAALLEEWRGSLEGDDVHFLVARILEEADRFEEAAREYELSAAREPLLADHAAYRAGTCWEEAGAEDEALAAYETAGAAARGARLSARAFWNAASLAAAEGHPERALESLERIPSRSVIDRQDLLDLEVRIYRAQGAAQRELRALRELLDRVPSSEEAVAAIQRMEELEPPTVQDRIAFAQAALQNRHGQLARKQAEAALAELGEDVDPELEGAARLALGKALIRQNHLTQARDELARLPEGAAVEDRAEADLDRARCLWRLGQIDACLAEYDRVADSDYPEEFRATAAWEAGREAKDNRRWNEAALRLAEFQRTYPENDYADDAAWHAGRSAAEARALEDALTSFTLLQVHYPDSPFVEEAGYWIAKLYREHDRDTDACSEVGRLLADHPDSYWTQRARETFGDSCSTGSVPDRVHDLRDWLAERSPDEDDSARERAGATIRASAPYRRGQLLAAVGLLTEAEDELDGLRRSLERDPSTLLAFAEAAWQAGVTRSGMRAITVLRAQAGLPILSGETPAAVARLLYPVDHLDAVLRWSQEYDLDPLFVYAVMREESWFDQYAESWVGARGLLQIMPSTGRDLARRVGMPGYDRADLFDPDVNIRLGTFYLSALLRELDSEPALALSAYNAGKRNALRWRASSEAIHAEAAVELTDGGNGESAFDVDRFVAGITYSETYNYVQKVTRSWAIYRHLWGDLVPRFERLRDGESAAR